MQTPTQPIRSRAFFSLFGSQLSIADVIVTAVDVCILSVDVTADRVYKVCHCNDHGTVDQANSGLARRATFFDRPIPKKMP